MRYPNLQAIKQQLPRGAMTQIANDLGITTKKVSDFFNKGWHKGLTNDILSRSIELLKEASLDGDMMKELNDLKLTSSHNTVPASRKQKKNNPGNPEDELGDPGDYTFEDLDSMPFDVLSEFVEVYELDLDPDDYEDGIFMSARSKLRNAICDELGIEEEPEGELEEEPEEE